MPGKNSYDLGTDPLLLSDSAEVCAPPSFAQILKHHIYHWCVQNIVIERDMINERLNSFPSREYS